MGSAPLTLSRRGYSLVHFSPSPGMLASLYGALFHTPPEMMINSLTRNGSSAPLGAWVVQEAGRVLGGVGLLGLLAFLLGDTFSEPASLKGIRRVP